MSSLAVVTQVVMEAEFKSLEKLSKTLTVVDKKQDKVNKNTKKASGTNKKNTKTVNDQTKANKSLSSILTKMPTKYKLIGAAITGVTAAYAAAFVGSTTYARTLTQLATTANISTTELQQLTYAFRDSGLGMAEIADGMTDFTEKLGEAAAGTGPLKETLDALGKQHLYTAEYIDKPVDALLEFGDALDGLTKAQQTFFTNEVLSGSMRGLAPIIVTGSAAMREQMVAATELGLVLDERLVAAGNRTQRQMTTLTTIVSTRLKKALLETTPVVDSLMSAFLDESGELTVLAETFSLIGIALIKVGGIIVQVIGTALSQINNLATLMKSAVTLDWEGVKESFMSLGSDMVEGYMNVFEMITGKLSAEAIAEAEALKEIIDGEGDGEGSGNGGAKVQKLREQLSAMENENFAYQAAVSQDLEGQLYWRFELEKLAKRRSLASLFADKNTRKDAEKIYSDWMVTQSTDYEQQLATIRKDAWNKAIDDQVNAHETLKAGYTDYYNSRNEAAQAASPAGVDGDSMWLESTHAGLTSLQNTLVEFAATGKASMKSMAASMLQDMAAVIAKAYIMKSLGISASGFTGGGLAGFFGATPAASSKGNIVTGKQLHPSGATTMAEQGPEAILPVGRDSQGRMGVIGLAGGNAANSGGGGNTYVVNITANTDKPSDISEAVIRGLVQAEARNVIAEESQLGGMLGG